MFTLHFLSKFKKKLVTVVTGATDGIGKSFAKHLAAAGLNIVLVSRNPAKLKQVANEISKLNI